MNKNSQELLEILILKIPQAPIKEDGFLDIIDHHYKENTISKVYSYFLNRNKNIAIANLFIGALKELVFEKTKIALTLTDYYCITEKETDSNGRIDILIKSDKDDQAIIIENKIYHWLGNDLTDYWNSTRIANKIGVILTLHSQSISSDITGNFVNITHLEWINKIKFKGLPTGLSIKEYIYINDFLSNMIELTDSNVISEAAEFYFDNTETIIKAMETHSAAKKFINDQLEIVAGNVGWDLEGQNSVYRYIWDKKNNNEKVCYVVFIDSLLIPKPNVTILIEFNKDTIAIESTLTELVFNLPEYKNLNKGKNGGADWKHFVSKTYDLKKEEIITLSTFITNKINTDFQPIMNKLLSYLSSKKN